MLEVLCCTIIAEKECGGIMMLHRFPMVFEALSGGREWIIGVERNLFAGSTSFFPITIIHGLLVNTQK
jgi:hypothetical protein